MNICRSTKFTTNVVKLKFKYEQDYYRLRKITPDHLLYWYSFIQPYIFYWLIDFFTLFFKQFFLKYSIKNDDLQDWITNKNSKHTICTWIFYKFSNSFLINILINKKYKIFHTLQKINYIFFMRYNKHDKK